MGTNLDILLLLIILSATFMAFRAWGQGREGIDGKGQGARRGRWTRPIPLID